MDYKAWIASLRDSATDSVERVGEHLPGILAAVALLLLGWLAAWLARFVSMRLVGRLSRLVASRTLKAEMRSAGVESIAPKVVGGFVYWVVLLFFFAGASEVVGLTVVSDGLSRLAGYLPQVLAAALVVLCGLVLANLSRRAVVSASTSAGIAHGELIGRSVRLAIMLVAGVVALDQIGIDSSVLNLLVLIAVGAMLGGTALAFGLGARNVVGDLLAVHYLARTYRAGQVIRVGELQGRIVEFTSTGVMLQTDDGQVLVPGADLGQSRSILVDDGS